MMNLWDKVKQIAGGTVNLTTWVGSGGLVVDQDEAQRRADTCLKCPLNQPGDAITAGVAEATRKFLAFKNELQLRVQGEKKLHHCKACGCVIRLLIWQPAGKVREEMTPDEIAQTPAECWKPKP